MPATNKSLEAPTWRAITPSDTVNEPRTLRGFDVWAAGDVKWRCTNGYEQTHTFAAPFPVRVTGQIERIYSTLTTVASPTVNIVGLE